MQKLASIIFNFFSRSKVVLPVCASRAEIPDQLREHRAIASQAILKLTSAKGLFPSFVILSEPSRRIFVAFSWR
jgi:hypothetical protein